MRISFAQAARPAGSFLAAIALLGRPAVSSLGGQAPAPQAIVTREGLRRALDALRPTEDGAKLPTAETFTFGDATVAAGSKRSGTLAIANGTLHVRGLLDGNAVTYGGDIIVHEGGEVRGDAIAIRGKVALDGGRVDGDVRAVVGNLAAVDGAETAGSSAPRGAVFRALALAVGWLAVLGIVGIAVLVFASSNLDAVSDTLEHHFGRAFFAGILGQLALLPALAVLCVALALTVLGILLIPFAVVAYVLAVAGLVTLGYLAIARISGASFLGSAGTTERERRRVALRALLVGLVIVMSPWLIAALFSSSPKGSLVAHAVAIAVTWVASTAGLGAALVSRGGVHRRSAPEALRAMAAATWQTPTPISGVTASRRPTPVATRVPK